MFNKIIVLSLVSICFAGYLPPDFPICKRNDPNLRQCLTNAANTLRPRIANGVRELGVPPIEPLILPQVTLEQGTQAVNYKIDLTEVKIHGMDNYHFKELNFDPNTYVLSGLVLFDKLLVDAKYNIDGKILVAPIKGYGKVKVTTGPANATFTLKGGLKRDGNAEYVVPSSAKVKLLFSNAVGEFDGAINNNEELSIATNRILNENSQDLLREAVPSIERVTEELLIKLWGGINQRISYNTILPPN